MRGMGMTQLLDTENAIKIENNISSEWSAFKKQFEQHLKISKLNITRNEVIDINNLFLKLLHMGYVDTSLDLFDYLSIVDSRINMLVSSFGITSAVNRGKMHTGLLYGGNYKEFIILDTSVYDPYVFINEWKNQSPLVIHEHQEDDCNLILLNGNTKTTKSGISICSINISKLFLQYRCYVASLIEMNEKNNSTFKPNVKRFLNYYVLQNALNSHLDVMILNRINRLFFSEEKLKAGLEEKLNVALYSAIKRNGNSGFDFLKIMKNLPSFNNSNLNIGLKLPSVAKTEQVNWLLTMCKIKIYEVLNNLSGERGINSNRKYMNRIIYDCERLLKDGQVKNLIGGATHNDIESRLTNLKLINR